MTLSAVVQILVSASVTCSSQPDNCSGEQCTVVSRYNAVH